MAGTNVFGSRLPLRPVVDLGTVRAQVRRVAAPTRVRVRAGQGGMMGRPHMVRTEDTGRYQQGGTGTWYGRYLAGERGLYGNN